ncbi:MAG TPA: PaaI family thioesterase, partial [Herpetosiphonaceae bacterium]
LRLASVEPGRAVVQVTPGEFHYNPIGSVHGGLLATIADSALGCAIHTTLPAGVGYTTIELHTNFLRAITVGSGEITCAAEVIHAGGRIATAQAKVYDAAGKIYGHATTTCMILRPQSAKTGEQG